MLKQSIQPSELRNVRLSTVIGFSILLYGGCFIVQTANIQSKLSNSTIFQSIVSLPALVVVALGVVFALLEYRYSKSRKAAIALLAAPLLGAGVTYVVIV